MRLSLTIGSVIFILLCIVAYMRQEAKKSMPNQHAIITTEHPRIKTITHTIHTSGTISLHNPMKIGSIVSGTIKKIYVEENDSVVQGQPLAEIDPGSGKTDFETAKLTVEKKRKEYEYAQSHFKRMESLFKANQLAKDAFEKLTKELETTRLDLGLAEISLQKNSIEIENRIIRAPANGVITAISIMQGETVVGSNAGGSTALFELATDTTAMLANIDIDESDIGSIHAKQPVTITVNTYPETPITSALKSVSFSPKPNKDAAGNLFYRAIAPLNNTAKNLRPGMGITCAIEVTRIPRALCIKSLALTIDAKHLEAAARDLNCSIIPMSKQDKKEFKQEHPGERIKFVWIYENKIYTERGVLVGIIDDAHVNIKHGLHKNDQIVTNVTEPKPAETSLLQKLKLG